MSIARSISLLSLLILTAGCTGDSPTGLVRLDAGVNPEAGIGPGNPIRTGGDGRLPVAVGNRWKYDLSSRFYRSDDPSGGLSDEGWLTREMIGTVVLGDHVYVREQVVVHFDSSSPDGVSEVLVRQDENGYYEISVSAGLAIHSRSAVLSGLRAPGGWKRQSGRGPRLEQAGGTTAEYVTLLYPLHSGAAWVPRESPLRTARIAGFDVLTLPAGRFGAWEVVEEAVSDEFQETSHAWFGRAGFVKFHGTVIFDTGGPVTWVVEFRMDLAELSLAEVN